MTETEKRLARVARLAKKPPQEKFVSRGRYLWVMAERAIFRAASYCFYVLGSTVLIAAVGALCVNLFVAGLIGMVGAMLIAIGIMFRDTAQSIKTVLPFTRHTAALLPLEESLVRPADFPLSSPQAHLLRAVQSEAATPQEELLRATLENRPVKSVK